MVMLAESAVADELLKESIINHPYAHFHEDENGAVPRSSSILKLSRDSLHVELTFGQCSDWFRRHVDRTAREGVRIHSAIEQLLSTGERTDSLDYNESKKMARFERWKNEMNPELLTKPDSTIISHELGFSGTPDLVCKINGKTCVIDVKTGESLHDIHYLQAQSYAMLLEKECGITIDKIAILLLGQERAAKDCLHVQNPSEYRRQRFNALLNQWYTYFPEPFGERHKIAA